MMSSAYVGREKLQNGSENQPCLFPSLLFAALFLVLIRLMNSAGPTALADSISVYAGAREGGGELFDRLIAKNRKIGACPDDSACFKTQTNTSPEKLCNISLNLICKIEAHRTVRAKRKVSGIRMLEKKITVTQINRSIFYKKREEILGQSVCSIHHVIPIL